MAPIYQLSEQDVLRSSTLDDRDVGKWVWVANGFIQGFTDTREEAQDMIDRCIPPNVIAVIHPEEETH